MARKPKSRDNSAQDSSKAEHGRSRLDSSVSPGDAGSLDSQPTPVPGPRLSLSPFQGSSEPSPVKRVVGGSIPPLGASFEGASSLPGGAGEYLQATPQGVGSLPHTPRGRLSLFVADDGKTLDPTRWEEILVAFLKHRCSLTKTAKELQIPLGTLRRWRKTDEAFGAALSTLEDILRDEVHSQYIEKALDPYERNPAWKIFYLKKWDPRYADAPGKGQQKVEIIIRDGTFEKTTGPARDGTFEKKEESKPQ